MPSTPATASIDQGTSDVGAIGISSASPIPNPSTGYGLSAAPVLPALPLAIIGTAAFGPLGRAQIYSSADEATQALGGRSVARIAPAPGDTSLALASTFFPDDPTLQLEPPWVYHCPPGQTYSVRYPYLSGLQGTPGRTTFDPLGFAAPAALGIIPTLPTYTGLNSVDSVDSVEGAGGTFLPTSNVFPTYAGLNSVDSVDGVEGNGTAVLADSTAFPTYTGLNSIDSVDGVEGNGGTVLAPLFSGLQSTPGRITFAPLGFDASVAYAPGGLFLEAPSIFSPSEKLLVEGGNPQGGLLLPLLAALAEEVPVAGIRAGASWLPGPNPRLTLPCGVVLAVDAQGSGDVFDRALTPYAHLTNNSLILDPGLLGLPYVRRTYAFSAFSSWQSLVSEILSDAVRGFTPFFPQSDGPSGAVLPSLTVTLFPTYPLPGGVAPDLTTAKGWAGVLEAESLDLDEYPLVCLSGLTGRALADDPASASRILAALDGQVLVLPWDLFPQCVPYDPTVDLAACAGLRATLPADNLWLVWGWGWANSLPLCAGAQVLLPCAYAVAAATSRETGQTTGNPIRPPLRSLSSREYFGQDLSPGNVVLASPAPVDLAAMRAVGLSPLSRASSGWSIYAQALHGPLSQTFTLLALGRAITLGVDPFLGQPDSPAERATLSAALSSALNAFSSTPLGSFTASFSADLLDLSRPGLVEIACTVRFHGETSSVSFQLTLQSRS